MKGEGMDKVREALAELEQAEAHYRLTYQIAPSVGHLDVGRAWDRMRKAGDAAREALSAQPAEPVALIAAAVERVRNTIILECETHEMLRENIARRVADVGKPTFAQPAPSEPAVPEGCACRWDADDKRVQTCERHQGWLDVIAEWADRARAAEAALAAARHPAAKGGEQ